MTFSPDSEQKEDEALGWRSCKHNVQAYMAYQTHLQQESTFFQSAPRKNYAVMQDKASLQDSNDKMTKTT